MNKNEISYSLLTEPWIEVVTLKGESKEVGLIELFENAHLFERFNFSMPGFDLAVLRFLIALVYIIGPPETLIDWKEGLKKGKFEALFIEGLKKYEERLNLFHPKYPFMQEVELKDFNLTSSTFLYKIIPGKTAPIHFNHLGYGTEYPICAKCIIPAILATQTYANSGGVAPKENNESRSYLAGINGASPIFVYLSSKNIYEQIFLNVLNKEYIESLIEKKEIGKNKWPKDINNYFDVTPDQIGIIDGYLWKPRTIFLNPESNKQNVKCVICGKNHPTIIKNMNFRSGKYRISGNAFWHDPMTAKIHKEDGTVTRAALSGTDNAEKSGWRDYISLLYKEKKIGGKKNEKLFERFIPYILQQSANIEKLINIKVNIFSLIVETSSQPQLKKVLVGKFEFHPNLIKNEYYQNQLKEILIISKSSESILKYTLKIANNDKIKISISEKFWKGLELFFNEILHKMININNDYIPVKDWKIILSNYLKDLYKSHTNQLIDKSEFLKYIEKGSQVLNNFIYKNLTEKGGE